MPPLHIVAALTWFALISGLRCAVAEEPLAGEEIELFSPRVPWYESARQSGVREVTGQVGLLLKADWDRRSVTEDKAIRAYLAAERLCPEDGRLPFAWGLFLRQLGDKTKARSAFEKAVAISPRFLAGQQAAAWANLEFGDANRGLIYLEGLVDALDTSESKYPSADQKWQAAQWLGRASGYLEGPSLTRPPAERMNRIDSKLRALSPDFGMAAAEGRRTVREQSGELQDLLKHSPDELQTHFQKQLDEARKELLSCTGKIFECKSQINAKATEIDGANRQGAQGIERIRPLMRQVEIHEARASLLRKASYGRVIEDKEPQYKREKQEDGSFKEVLDGYKTIKRRLPETAEETKRRKSAIEQEDAKGDQNRNAIEQIESRLKAPSEWANNLSKKAAILKDIVADYDVLQAQKRELQQTIAQLLLWQNDPKQFETYAVTVEAYVPWDVELLREALLKSFKFDDD